MRSTLVALIGLSFIACNGDKAQQQSDMAASNDFAMMGGDLAVTPKNGCNGLNACNNLCASTDMPCLNACKAGATMNAQTLLDNAVSCGQDWCLAADDMGTGHCMLDPTGMTLIDPTGSPAGTCNNCLNDATAKLNVAPAMCMDPTGPDCNPAPCLAMENACLADKP